MRITAVVAVVVVLGAVAPGAAAQEPVDTPGESWFNQFDYRGSEEFGFALYNGCSPIDVVAFVDVDVDGDDDDYGVTVARIRDLAESRLRGARLYAESWILSGLMADVTFFDRGFSVEVSFWKLLEDTAASRRARRTRTWIATRRGTHGGDGDYVMYQLSELVDRFLLEFLRENDEACRAVP